MKFLVEYKTTAAPTKTPTVDKAPTEEPSIASSSTASSKVFSTTTEKPAMTRDQLRRLRRQLALESELSSAQDESENLGIEQVSFFLLHIDKS